jgi:hypothetical protein
MKHGTKRFCVVFLVMVLPDEHAFCACSED